MINFDFLHLVYLQRLLAGETLFFLLPSEDGLGVGVLWTSMRFYRNHTWVSVFIPFGERGQCLRVRFLSMAIILFVLVRDKNGRSGSVPITFWYREIRRSIPDPIVVGVSFCSFLRRFRPCPQETSVRFRVITIGGSFFRWRVTFFHCQLRFCERVPKWRLPNGGMEKRLFLENCVRFRLLCCGF